MKKNTIIILFGYLLIILAVISFVLAIGMEEGYQFWTMTSISIGYLVCSGFVFDSKIKCDIDRF